MTNEGHEPGWLRTVRAEGRPFAGVRPRPRPPRFVCQCDDGAEQILNRFVDDWILAGRTGALLLRRHDGSVVTFRPVDIV